MATRSWIYKHGFKKLQNSLNYGYSRRKCQRPSKVASSLPSEEVALAVESLAKGAEEQSMQTQGSVLL